MQAFGDTMLELFSKAIESLLVLSRLPARFILHTLSLVVRDPGVIYLDAIVLEAVTDFQRWENKRYNEDTHVVAGDKMRIEIADIVGKVAQVLELLGLGAVKEVPGHGERPFHTAENVVLQDIRYRGDGHWVDATTIDIVLSRGRYRAGDVDNLNIFERPTVKFEILESLAFLLSLLGSVSMLGASLASRYNGLPRCSKPVQLSNGCGVMHLESGHFHRADRGTYSVSDQDLWAKSMQKTLVRTRVSISNSVSSRPPHQKLSVAKKASIIMAFRSC